MKHVLMGAVSVMSVFLLAGCSELRHLRVESAEQKLAIARLTEEGATCRKSLEEAQGQLLQARGEIRGRQARLDEQEAACDRMREEMQAKLDSQQREVDELKGRYTLTMVESLLFDPGRAEVKKKGFEVLQKVAQTLKDIQDQEIVVAGYTDSSRIRGSLSRVFPSNWELSTARAITVMKFLEAQGIDPKIMSAIGYGEHRPVADNGTPEGRARNRRMEIILMPLHH
jgi:chemotaxis protein MotB